MLKRTQVLAYFANLPPCMIGMEACAGAHFWARRPDQLGQEVCAGSTAWPPEGAAGAIFGG
jgi:transposase